MKSKLLKTMVLASSLAFFNCGDDAVTSAINNYGGLSSSSGEVQLGDDSSSSTSDVQGGGELNQQGGTEISSAAESSSATVQNPESSADVAASSSSEVAPASSADVAPASSSSEAKVESSSSEKAPVVSSSSSEKKVESSSSEEAKPKGVFLAEGKDETKDQMRVKYIERTGHDGGGILAYPEQLSNDQKHAVVVWGPGGGTEPGAYGGMIRRLASHGFVVIALRESPGNASQGKPALDWLEKKNKDPNDPLYNKLDMTKVGCSGHSMGGLESEQMVIQDSRVITAMLNNSGDLGHTAMSQVPQGKTIGIVYGEGGMERPNAEADYNNPGVKVPACLIKMTGGQGNECQQGECGWGHGSGPWGGMAATVAWMRWHLGGEDFRKADFVGTSGRYINGEIIGERGRWKGTCKNF
ncbi:MAG: alpha/beta hydrolase [Fibrobacter sp.]|uniref:poly(ethylene terephthalate) hydrolase family protein n=1 Tax=Fibrobacter sp. TaxID=35828 RepID=UPI0025B83BAF|nr:alpha/beta hydrolase [Fibrobacter sp.]MBQ7078453.1 alpha/beta hydrolase [Fibrobacter sp.]